MNLEFSKFFEMMNFTTVYWEIFSVLCFILGDIIAGFISAVIAKNVDSQKMREGLLRKILLLLILGLSFVIQYAFFNMTIISKVVALYIIFMEIISILENVSKAGIDLRKLGEFLKIKQDNEDITIELKKINENSLYGTMKNGEKNNENN